MKLVNIHFFVFLLVWNLTSVELQGQTMTLQQCTDAALSNNKNLQMLRHNLKSGDLRKREAASNFLPKISATADYKYFSHLPYQLMPLSAFNPTAPEGQFREAQFGVPHNLGVNVQFTMPLYNPQLKAAVKGAEIAAEMGDLQVEKSEEQVIFEVTNLYYNAQILKYQIQFADSNLVNVDRLLSTIELLRQQGLAKGTDLSKVVLQQAQIQSQREQLEGKLSQVFNGLNFLMGRDLQTPLSVDSAIAKGSGVAYPISPSVDIRMIQIQGRLLENDLWVLKKSALPTVAIVANYGITGFGYFKQPDPFFKTFPIGFIGAQAAFPICNRTTSHKIAQKGVEIRGNRLQSELIQAQNELQITNAVLQKDLLLQHIPVVQQQIDLANSIYEQTRLQHQQGMATISEIILADNAVREAQTSYLNALVEYLKADLEWKKSSGSIKK